MASKVTVNLKDNEPLPPPRMLSDSFESTMRELQAEHLNLLIVEKSKRSQVHKTDLHPKHLTISDQPHYPLSPQPRRAEEQQMLKFLRKRQLGDRIIEPKFPLQAKADNLFDQAKEFLKHKEYWEKAQVASPSPSKKLKPKKKLAHSTVWSGRESERQRFTSYTPAEGWAYYIQSGDPSLIPPIVAQQRQVSDFKPSKPLSKETPARLMESREFLANMVQNSLTPAREKKKVGAILSDLLPKPQKTQLSSRFSKSKAKSPLQKSNTDIQSVLESPEDERRAENNLPSTLGVSQKNLNTSKSRQGVHHMNQSQVHWSKNIFASDITQSGKNKLNPIVLSQIDSEQELNPDSSMPNRTEDETTLQGFISNSNRQRLSTHQQGNQELIDQLNQFEQFHRRQHLKVASTNKGTSLVSESQLNQNFEDENLMPRLKVASTTRQKSEIHESVKSRQYRAPRTYLDFQKKLESMRTRHLFPAYSPDEKLLTSSFDASMLSPRKDIFVKPTKMGHPSHPVEKNLSKDPSSTSQFEQRFLNSLLGNQVPHIKYIPIQMKTFQNFDNLNYQTIGSPHATYHQGWKGSPESKIQTALVKHLTPLKKKSSRADKNPMVAKSIDFRSIDSFSGKFLNLPSAQPMRSPLSSFGKLGITRSLEGTDSILEKTLDSPTQTILFSTNSDSLERKNKKRVTFQESPLGASNSKDPPLEKLESLEKLGLGENLQAKDLIGEISSQIDRLRARKEDSETPSSTMPPSKRGTFKKLKVFNNHKLQLRDRKNGTMLEGKLNFNTMKTKRPLLKLNHGSSQAVSKVDDKYPPQFGQVKKVEIDAVGVEKELFTDSQGKYVEKRQFHHQMINENSHLDLSNDKTLTHEDSMKHTSKVLMSNLISPTDTARIEDKGRREVLSKSKMNYTLSQEQYPTDQALETNNDSPMASQQLTQAYGNSITSKELKMVNSMDSKTHSYRNPFMEPQKHDLPIMKRQLHVSNNEKAQNTIIKFNHKKQLLRNEKSTETTGTQEQRGELKRNLSTPKHIVINLGNRIANGGTPLDPQNQTFTQGFLTSQPDKSEQKLVQSQMKQAGVLTGEHDHIHMSPWQYKESVEGSQPDRGQSPDPTADFPSMKIPVNSPKVFSQFSTKPQIVRAVGDRQGESRQDVVGKGALIDTQILSQSSQLGAGSGKMMNRQPRLTINSQFNSEPLRIDSLKASNRRQTVKNQKQSSKAREEFEFLKKQGLQRVDNLGSASSSMESSQRAFNLPKGNKYNDSSLNNLSRQPSNLSRLSPGHSPRFLPSPKAEIGSARKDGSKQEHLAQFQLNLVTDPANLNNPSMTITSVKTKMHSQTVAQNSPSPTKRMPNQILTQNAQTGIMSNTSLTPLDKIGGTTRKKKKTRPIGHSQITEELDQESSQDMVSRQLEQLNDEGNSKNEDEDPTLNLQDQYKRTEEDVRQKSIPSERLIEVNDLTHTSKSFSSISSSNQARNTKKQLYAEHTIKKEDRADEMKIIESNPITRQNTKVPEIEIEEEDKTQDFVQEEKYKAMKVLHRVSSNFSKEVASRQGGSSSRNIYDIAETEELKSTLKKKNFHEEVVSAIRSSVERRRLERQKTKNVIVQGKIKHLGSKNSQQSSPQSSKSNLHSTGGAHTQESLNFTIDQLTEMFMNQAQTELQLVTEKDVPYYLQPETSLEAIRRKSKRLPTFKMPEPVRSFSDRGFDPDEFIKKQVLREGQTELDESDIAKLPPSVRKFLEAKGKEKEAIIEGIYKKMPTLKKEEN